MRKVKTLQQRVRNILEDWLEYYRRATGTSPLLFSLPKHHVFQSESLLGAVQSLGGTIEVLVVLSKKLFFSPGLVRRL